MTDFNTIKYGVDFFLEAHVQRVVKQNKSNSLRGPKDVLVPVCARVLMCPTLLQCAEKVWSWTVGERNTELKTESHAMLSPSTKLDDLATTCNSIDRVGEHYDPILSRGRPSLAKSEPTMQCLICHMKCTSSFVLDSVGNSYRAAALQQVQKCRAASCSHFSIYCK